MGWFEGSGLSTSLSLSLSRDGAQATHQPLDGGARTLLEPNVPDPQCAHPRAVAHTTLQHTARAIDVLQLAILPARPRGTFQRGG
jgi:hypothetical protein